MSLKAELQEAADKILRSEAFDNLAERLRSGQRVGRCDFTDLLESEWNSEAGYARITSEVSALLQTETKRDYLADKIRDGIIERYLLDPKNDYLLAEEAAQIEVEPAAYFEDAEAVGMS